MRIFLLSAALALLVTGAAIGSLGSQWLAVRAVRLVPSPTFQNMPADCTPQHEGLLAYSSGDGLCVCDGNAWRYPDEIRTGGAFINVCGVNLAKLR